MTAALGWAWITGQRTNTQNRQPESQLSHHKRIAVAAGLLLGLSLVLLGITVVLATLIRRSEPLSNPFLSYIDFVQVGSLLNVNTLQERGFTCNKDFISPDNLYCSLHPTEGAFYEIAAKLTRGIVQQVTFGVNDRMLTAGDLAGLWGNPDIQMERQSANLLWRHISVAAVAETNNQRFSYWLPITYVTFGLIR